MRGSTGLASSILWQTPTSDLWLLSLTRWRYLATPSSIRIGAHRSNVHRTSWRACDSPLRLKYQTRFSFASATNNETPLSSDRNRSQGRVGYLGERGRSRRPLPSTKIYCLTFSSCASSRSSPTRSINYVLSRNSETSSKSLRMGRSSPDAAGVAHKHLKDAPFSFWISSCCGSPLRLHSLRTKNQNPSRLCKDNGNQDED